MNRCDNCRFWRRLSPATGSCSEDETGLVVVTAATFSCGNWEKATDDEGRFIIGG